MRKMIAIGLLLILISGCADKLVTFEEPKKVGVHFLYSFGFDHVSLKLDGVEMYSDTVSTSPMLGVASTTSLLFTKSRQMVRVTVNDNSKAQLIVDPRTTKTISVLYDRKKNTLNLYKLKHEPKYY